MDEPFSALDAQSRALMQLELLALWERTRRAILYVTHQIQEAVLLGDRVVVMSRRPGRIRAVRSVPLPRPRDERTMLDPRFVALVDECWQLIKHDAREALADGPSGRAHRRVRGRAGAAPRGRPGFSAAAALALITLAWEAVRGGLGVGVPALFLPAPTAVLGEAVRMAWSGELGRHLGVSLARVGLGFGLGAAVGTVLGLALGSSRSLWAIGNPVIAATYPIPKIAPLPLMILWLGIGEAPKVTMIALGVFFPVVINTYAGVQGTDPLMVKAARSLGAGRWQVVLKGAPPSALPTILAGYRLGAGIALLLVVSAEMINATGDRLPILDSGDLMLTGKLMVGLATLSLLGLASTWALRGLEAWLTPWKEEARR